MSSSTSIRVPHNEARFDSNDRRRRVKGRTRGIIQPRHPITAQFMADRSQGEHLHSCLFIPTRTIHSLTNLAAQSVKTLDAPRNDPTQGSDVHITKKKQHKSPLSKASMSSGDKPGPGTNPALGQPLKTTRGTNTAGIVQ